MKKENILSVLIDKSGDFEKLDNNDSYYYVLMVLHEQKNSINDMVEALETKFTNWGYKNHYIHVGPLIRREGSSGRMILFVCQEPATPVFKRGDCPKGLK